MSVGRQMAAGLGDLREAEIQDFDARRAVRALGDEEVRRFEIAVHDAERVRVRDAIASLENVRHRFADGQALSPPQERRQVHTLEVLHHDVRSTRLELADVDHARDVIALDVGARAGLSQQARCSGVVAHGVGREELDGHAALELQVRRCDDDAHAAGSEDVVDPVFAGQDLSWL
jgi:hypothetical protein